MYLVSFRVWKHQPVLSTVATVMSKSSILCTEWASKTDKAVSSTLIHKIKCSDRMIT